MMFCGRNFCADRNSLGYTPTNLSGIQRIKLQNGIFDALHVNRNVTFPYTSVIPDSPEKWDYDTILLALFNENLIAGNIPYEVSQINKIRVKVRPKGSFNWTTIYEVPISSVDDLYFDRYYKYCRSNEHYEFAIVPVLYDVEGNVNINEIYSKFDGLYLIEKDNTFYTLLQSTITTQKNRPVSYVQTINKKYPYVYSHGENNFYTGSVTTEFLSRDRGSYSNGDIKDTLKNSWKYRRDLFEFLCNGNTKILKYFDGRMWMINITNSPSEGVGDLQYLPSTTFEWIEVGNCASSTDLYDNNFIDVNVEGS